MPSASATRDTQIAAPSTPPKIRSTPGLAIVRSGVCFFRYPVAERNMRTAIPRARSSPDDLRGGSQVGEYQIISKIAEGGMGSVYAATHPVIGKRAAIKVLKRSLCTNQEVVRRFVDEARAANQIGHENIVDVFAFGVIPDGRSYFVMEWLDGHTLYERIAAKDLSTIDKIDILDQLANALMAAHAKGIVHRDIKPENVFLVQDRERTFVKLLDFGVAKLGMIRHASDSVSVLGTPAYISPEQASAEDVDARTDIYSAGIIAFEMFAGKRPFEAENPVEMLTKHLHQSPPTPVSINAEIPLALDELILQMIAKKRDQRPSLTEVRAVLQELKIATLMAQSSRADREAPSLHRPLLIRSFSGLARMSHPLIAELSRGTAWIETEGKAPMAGTPITIRFAAEKLGAQVEFGGIVSRYFGTTQKALVRYDRVEKSKLDRIFTLVASAASSGTKEGAEPGEGSGAWLGPIKSSREGQPSLRPASALDTRSELPARSDVPAKDEPRRALFGLGARVLMATVVVTVGAVSSVTWIALERARTDRSFYTTELNMRTSQLLLDVLTERRESWKNRLTLAAAGGIGGRFELGDFKSLTICEKAKCEAVAGAPLTDKMLDRAKAAARGAATKNDVALLPLDESSLIAAVATERATTIATLPRGALLDARRVPQDLTAFVMGDERTVLAERPGPNVSGNLADHEIASDLATSKQRTSAREYAAPDGTPMHGAWTRNRDLAVVVAAPTRLTSDATRVLAQQVMLVALIVLGISATVALVFARTMTRRLRKLAKHASRIASGDFSAKPQVTGSDEVGQLAGSFLSMTEALKERDEDVLRIRQKMSEDETEAMHRQMSEWLETDLATTLSSIQEVVRQPVNARDPARDLDHRKEKLEHLAAQATASLQQALAFATIASRRVDFASTVADAVAYARTALHGSKVGVELDAKNAVLFPRLDAKESEIREMVQTLVLRSAKLTQPGERIVTLLFQTEATLNLAVRYPKRDGVEEAANAALDAVHPIVVSHGATAGLRDDGDALAVVIGFPVSESAAELKP
jgi:serine/threonine protein kinase/HAMP domain-containing protein